MPETVTLPGGTTASQAYIPARPWKGSALPKRVLAIRLQAMGDLVACLPYLQYLRNTLPSSVQLDLLTREETADIPRNIHLFNAVYAIGGGRNFRKQLVYGALFIPALFLKRYDVILDLQNNKLSRLIRKALWPNAWVEFDRFSPIAGGERYRLTIEAAGLGHNEAHTRFQLKDPLKGRAILKAHGWRGEEELVVLNPAGAFETRNWSLHNFVAFARLWLNEFPRTRFLVPGTSFIAAKAGFLQEQLGDHLINLVGKTTPFEAFAVLQHVQFVLSEDSGLLHMAWCSGIPSMALFGGTRTDWVRPLGDHTFFLDASDLQCGGCMQETCRFGDVHCMTRYTPEMVFHHAKALLNKLRDRDRDMQSD